MWVRLLFIMLFLFSLSGCVTTSKGTLKAENQQLSAQVSNMELQLRQKEEEIAGLEKELEAREKESTSWIKKADAGKPSAKEIQAALKNAGFYNGPIDGSIGKNTKKAISGFQEA